MTTLIYRGVTHDAQRPTAPRTPQTLIYRGIAHDGMTAEAAPAGRGRRDMCYRGIRHVLGGTGAVATGARAASISRLADLPV
jgi:hypothetical protein